jgi:acetoin utilization protein AcuB
MLVKNRMTPNPVVVAPDASHSEAFRILHDQKFSYLPVVNRKGKLVGVVTESDLTNAKPSAATSLSIYELNYLLAHLKVEDIMSTPPITVSEDTPLEEAARVMIESNIGCLPVMRGDDLVGVITETDIFKSFVEVLGGGQAVLRVTVRVPDVPGELSRMSAVIAGLGGNLHAVAAFRGDAPGHVYIVFRLDGVDEQSLLPALKRMGEEVVHVCRVENQQRRGKK